MTTPRAAEKRPRSRPRWMVRLLAVLAILGPGLIAANAGNDAGGILTYASAGAQFGYRTLFLMVLVTVALVVVQEMCSRLGVYTGEGLGGLIREQFSARSTFVAMVLLLVANAGLTVSEFAGVGAAMEIFGVSPLISVPIAAVFVWALTVLGSYSSAERLFLILTLAFLAYPIAAFLGHPNGKEVLSNLVWPHFLASHAVPGARRRPDRHDHHALHAVLRRLRVRRQRHHTRRLPQRAHRHGQRRDLVRRHHHLHHHRHRGRDRRQRAAVVGAGGGGGVEARRRPGAPQLFAVGLLGASLLAASVVPLSTSYAIADATGGPRSVSKSLRDAPLFYGIFTLADRGRRGRRTRPGQPRRPRRQRPGAQRDHHTDAAHLRADPGQPVDGAGHGQERPDLQDCRHRMRRCRRTPVVCRPRRNRFRP